MIYLIVHDIGNVQYLLNVKNVPSCCDIEDTQRLVTEIEMLKVVLHLVVSRNRRRI